MVIMEVGAVVIKSFGENKRFIGPGVAMHNFSHRSPTVLWGTIVAYDSFGGALVHCGQQIGRAHV